MGTVAGAMSDLLIALVNFRERLDDTRSGRIKED
jgi:hypothetical protein